MIVDNKTKESNILFDIEHGKKIFRCSDYDILDNNIFFKMLSSVLNNTGFIIEDTVNTDPPFYIVSLLPFRFDSSAINHPSTKKFVEEIKERNEKLFALYLKLEYFRKKIKKEEIKLDKKSKSLSSINDLLESLSLINDLLEKNKQEKEEEEEEDKETYLKMEKLKKDKKIKEIQLNILMDNIIFNIKCFKNIKKKIIKEKEYIKILTN